MKAEDIINFYKENKIPDNRLMCGDDDMIRSYYQNAIDVGGVLHEEDEKGLAAVAIVFCTDSQMSIAASSVHYVHFDNKGRSMFMYVDGYAVRPDKRNSNLLGKMLIRFEKENPNAKGWIWYNSKRKRWFHSKRRRKSCLEAEATKQTRNQYLKVI